MPKESKKKKNNTKIEITHEMMKPYFYCPQTLAARLLGVSISTLKRRFYDLHIGRWPYQCISLSERKKSIYFLMNETEPEDEKEIDEKTMHHLRHAFKDASKPLLSMNVNQTTQFHFCSFVAQEEENANSDHSNSFQESNGKAFTAQGQAPHLGGGNGKKIVMREMELGKKEMIQRSKSSHSLSSLSGDNHPPYHPYNSPALTAFPLKKSCAVSDNASNMLTNTYTTQPHGISALSSNIKTFSPTSPHGVWQSCNTMSLSVNYPSQCYVSQHSPLSCGTTNSSSPNSPPAIMFGMGHENHVILPEIRIQDTIQH
ncbi:hypothetical protein NAEGRDRAFT_80436 [Naegleria gruberi]|uniref:RWP-RK domain-containing protein n=1 Tax=Naegleria gruberi TaxID=5762 RepID=D2VLF0_NAEGR|nr:uncharacterized protein NAEGRDRAFT_80436 [Naegleria gruberi]EFC42300.1 hypothetical protein NAEGRDRAFT_80436 [Naegleria gruberi]|eukprot:XP_002675044.1 hypothetical protein NAEGRDRAFT_80436 [Naegleria gruberi strain NEG-M]